MRFIFIVLFGLLTVLVGTSVYAQTEEDVKKEADALFSSANYVEATPLYLRLLSLQPRDANYNYKYGTCLLYNSENKSSAFKYLNYAVKTGGVDNEAYYFLGKAYHLTFQFNKAIANFSKYQQLAGEKALQRLDVNRQIEMCNNAKSLISNISELIVINKKQIDYNSFFRLYDLSNIGGTLIVTEEFQTKQDKKRDHLPLIHFPANPKRIFYSSYGEDGNGKDIYVRTRLPDNSWSLPMPVQGNVNTRYNEDYPYMHPDGRYLYFCSEGHNSMGGYDIFRSKYNADDNSFGPPENMDYAISSPDNDFFYVVDSLNKNAYFASQRESEDGKVHVYEVRVERFPVQIVIIKGQFSSTLNPGNKELEIEVYSASTDKQVGKFKTNKRGGYLINLPKGGKYEFKVRVGGKDTEYKQLIDVPFLKEFKPLKQRIDELQKDEGEIVTITNLFNEDFEDPVAVMAEIIQKRANLTPNVENYDLDSLDILAKNNKVLAQVGLNNFTEGEIKDLINSKVNDLTTLNQNIETSLVQNKNIQTELAQEANLLYKEINELIDASSSATNEETKKEKLNEAKEKFNELQTVLLKIESTKILEDQISAAQKNAKSELTQANQLKSDYDLASDSQSKLAAVVKNQSFVSSKLKKSTLLTTESMISSKIEQEIVKSQEVKKTIDDLNNQVTIIDSKINGINKKLNAAKKKEKEKLLTELNTLENEKLVISEEIVYQNTQVKNGYAPEEFLQAKLTLTELNNANTTLNETNTTLNLSFSDEDVLQKLNVIDEQIAQTSSQSNSKVETEINEITSVVNSNLYSDSELNETKEEIERKLKDSKQLLEELDLVNDNNVVSPEQFQKIKELKESIKKDIEKREKLLLTESTSSSEEISSSEITKLEKTSQQYKNELTETLQQLENEEITFEDSKKKSEAYLAQLENENNKLIKEISNKGMIDERSEKKAFLDKEIVEVQKNIAEIEQLEVKKEIYTTLKQDYEQKLTAIQNSQKSDLEKLKESLILEQKLSDRVNTKFDDIQKELLKNSNDITLKQQEWAANKILEDSKSRIEELNTSIEQLESEQAIANTSPEEKIEVDATEVLNEVLKSYATKTTEKATAYQNKEISTEEYLEFITENETKLGSEIASNNENITELTAEINELESKENPTAKDLSKLKERKTTVEVLKQTNTILEQEKITVSTKKEQLESEQAIANTSPEEKVEVDATEVLNEVLKSYATKTTEKATAYQNKEISTEEYLEFITENETKLSSEIASNNEKITELTAEINELESKENPTEKDLSKLKERKTTVEVLKQTNTILEQEKITVSTKKEQLESEQAIANTSPEEKVEVDAAEVLNEVLKSYATKTTEKATAYQNKEISTEEYLEFITENETKLSSEIASNNENITELTAEINELESKEYPTEKDLSKLKERKTTVEVLKQTNTILEQEKITVSTKKEQLESEQAIANTSPEEKIEVDATEVLNEVLKSYATKTTEKATAYQNKEISTEEYLEFITENETKLGSEIASNNEKIAELTAEINQLESKENPTEKDLSKLKERKTTVEVLKQTNAILEQEKITVSTKKEQLESEQAIANTSPEEKVEVDATEVLNNIIPDYRKELEEANSQFKTGEITVDELINLKKEKQNTLKVKLAEIVEEIAAGNSVTENTEISKVVTKEIKRISIEIGELEIDRNDIVQKENEEKAKLYVFDLKKKYEEIDNLELNDLSNREYQELVNFDKQLENLEIDLKESKASLNLEDKVYQAEVKNQLDAEINKIEKQRRVISIEIGDLETELVTTVKPEVQQVLNSEDAAEIKLNEENVIAEQNKLNQLISENPGKQKKIETQKVKVLKVENELLESTANSNQKFIDLNKTEVAKNAISSAKITQNEIEIASLENQLLDVKDEALKNSIRKEIVSKQNEIVEAISEAKIEEKIIDIYSEISENTSSETLKNPNGLKTNKDIEIETKNIENDLISLNVKIENLSKEIDSANKIDKLILVEKQNDLIELREVLNSKVLENNVELAKRNEVVAQDNSSGVEKESISTQISYEKELELASSDEYKELQKVSNQLDQVKYEAKVKRERVESKRIELQDFLKIQATNPSEENKQKITNTITEIEKIENDLKLLRIDLAALQLEINSNLPSDVTGRALVENLILRDVAPRDVKTQLQKPGELIQALSLGLNIDTESNKAELREEEIAINSDIPDGIVFRVQVGAFSKPVDKNTFTEFNPLSGEQIRAGLIRYMAGIFASKKDARIAQKSIRALGYSDAFVVAYCDQERIPVYKAEQLLASGACVSKIVSQEAVLVDNGTQLTEGNPNATVNTVEKLDQFSYNKAVGAAPAIAAESKQGLFFTVQVGVYNRPVSEEQLFNISPLVTLRLPNGQIRYSTGLFNSSLDAKSKQKDAIEKGVDDAFITAYYKGERIGVSKARKLLAEFGDVILEEKSPTVVEKGEVVENVELPDPIVPVVDKNEIEVKYFSKETYKEFPTQVLNRLNETGVNFYYNTSSNKIETGLLSNNEITKINTVEDEFESSEYYLGRKIKDVTATNPSDALYNSSIPQYALYVKVLGENINAGLMNRVYALGVNYSISSSNGNTTITFISSGNSADLKLIKQKLLSFNIAEMTIVRLKQTEF